MSDLLAMYTRQRKYMFFLLAIYVLGWGFTSYQTIFLGLILGTSISLFNLWHLAKKTKKLGDVVSQGKKKKVSLGLLTRMSASVLAIVVAMEYPQYFHLISVVIGIMTAYLVIMIDYFFQLFHLHN